ncbi:MFS transporter [Paenibacillus faecis]|uniref:MFS transporter n=1 Tax=Paenibacillus faecis TaxID=862114 RepID=A0A5D0CM68_9BACL|nr:MFS transporter [Paenibacillus faecis]TYA10385.1 MFS transporter [Paenibacillus faecis]
MARRNNLMIFILTIGVFGILNTEMGVIGILPSLADHYHVSVSQAGLLVSLFALGVAISGPILPLLFSGMDRKKVMLLVLGVFLIGNIMSIFTTNFTIALIARVVPAFFHPIYCSLAFSVAASSVRKEDAAKAVSKVFIGVSAGMVVGVPIVSFIANAASIEMAMAFFAVINAVVFLVTFLFVPTMPVKEKLSYGAQLRVLKKSKTWLSIAAVIFLNAAVFGVYSYLAEYLETVTNMSPNMISFMLFVYGGANIIGNMVAGKLLAHSAMKSVIAFPFVLGGVYLILFFAGEITLPMAIMTFIWGIVAGIGGNINQFWMASSAPEAPDFANGLFLTSCNIGTTVGAAAGGLFISGMGAKYVVLVGILSLILGLATILLRYYRHDPSEQLSD